MSDDSKKSGVSSSAVGKFSGGIIGLVLLAAILIASNAILNNVRIRADLTEDKLYTLSDGTKNLLKTLDRRVALKLFYSRSATQMPVYLKTHAQQVEDLLEEYRIASNGKVTVTVFDPEPDSDSEDLAKQYGIAANNVGMFGPAVYFGLAAVAGEAQGVIPALDPRSESLLEYNLSRLIYRVTHPDKPSVGVLSSLPVLGSSPPQMGGFQPPQQQPQPAWLSFQDIQRDYDLQSIPADASAIPDGLSALVVIHPKGLSEQTLFAIDQYVLSGGHLMAFLDPMSIYDLQNSGQQQSFGQPNASSNLEKLLAAWGLEFSASQIVADMKAVTMLRGANNQPEENAVFLSLRKMNGHLNGEDILTSQLNTMMLPFAGRFKDNTDEGVMVTPLLTSSDDSGEVSSFSAQFGAQAVRREYKKNGGNLHLAVRVSGTLKSAFPDGPPVAADAPAPEAPADSLKEGSSTVILVGDTDLLYDQFCVEAMNFFGQTAHRPLNDNLNFFANAIELVAGSSDLISVRSRGEFSRPFERVVALEEKARLQWQEQEKALNEKLQETRRRLSEMQSKKDDSQRFILSDEQQDAIKRFREEEISINKELKEVRKSLRKDIERLGLQVKVANIVLMPLIIAIAGVLFGIYRKKRM